VVIIKPTCPMRSLLLDNYDSYTYNLYQLISEACGGVNTRLFTCTRVTHSCFFSEEPLVYKNDAISISEILKLLSDGVIDNIVISPGPGTPTRKEDIGVPCLTSVLKANDFFH
jgi:para-aminobenzoate synthetase